MGLKFRRGTTAQKSGSLAFGEPYVNTTLGTLQIGGDTGDITLGASGTGSQGSFAGISGSSLDITGNAKIDGNLTLGGAITIGDNTSDTVNVIASLSSSLIPSLTNTFDLGSATKIWKDLYISTGSIKFVEGNTVVKSLSAATLTALETSTGSANASITSLNTYTGSNDTTNTAQSTRLTTIESVTGSYETKGRSIVSGSSQITYVSISSIPSGIVSGSSQISHDSTTGYSANKHIDHTSVLISAGNGLSGGGDISSTRTLTLDTGSAHFTSGIKTKLDLDTVISGSKTITVGSTAIALGGTATTIAGLTSVTSTGFTGALTGNASTATTAGTVTTAAQSAITSVGTLTSLTVSGATATGALTVTGAVTATGDITAFFTSDIRHKNNVQLIDNALDKVNALNGVTWEWNDDVNEVTKQTPKTGLIAQDVLDVLPEVVKTREDGFLALDYSKMVGLLVEAIKEQDVVIQKLKSDTIGLAQTITVFEDRMKEKGLL